MLPIKKARDHTLVTGLLLWPTSLCVPLSYGIAVGIGWLDQKL